MDSLRNIQVKIMILLFSDIKGQKRDTQINHLKKEFEQMRNVTFFGELMLLFSKIALASFDNKDLDPFINKKR